MFELSSARRVVTEILEYERNYLLDLDLVISNLVEPYYQQLSQSETELIKERDHNELFANLPQIYTLHSEIFEAFEMIVKEDLFPGSIEAEAGTESLACLAAEEYFTIFGRIAGIIGLLASSIEEAYKNYIESFVPSKATDLVEEYHANPHRGQLDTNFSFLVDLIAAWPKTTGKLLPLDAFLMKPFQHVLRYRTLFERLLSSMGTKEERSAFFQSYGNAPASNHFTSELSQRDADDANSFASESSFDRIDNLLATAEQETQFNSNQDGQYSELILESDLEKISLVVDLLLEMNKRINTHKAESEIKESIGLTWLKGLKGMKLSFLMGSQELVRECACYEVKSVLQKSERNVLLLDSHLVVCSYKDKQGHKRFSKMHMQHQTSSSTHLEKSPSRPSIISVAPSVSSPSSSLNSTNAARTSKSIVSELRLKMCTPLSHIELTKVDTESRVLELMLPSHVTIRAPDYRVSSQGAEPKKLSLAFLDMETFLEWKILLFNAILRNIRPPSPKKKSTDLPSTLEMEPLTFQPGSFTVPASVSVSSSSASSKKAALEKLYTANMPNQQMDLSPSMELLDSYTRSNLTSQSTNEPTVSSAAVNEQPEGLQIFKDNSAESNIESPIDKEANRQSTLEIRKKLVLSNRNLEEKKRILKKIQRDNQKLLEMEEKLKLEQLEIAQRLQAVDGFKKSNAAYNQKIKAQKKAQNKEDKEIRDQTLVSLPNGVYIKSRKSPAQPELSVTEAMRLRFKEKMQKMHHRHEQADAYANKVKILNHPGSEEQFESLLRDKFGLANARVNERLEHLQQRQKFQTKDKRSSVSDSQSMKSGSFNFDAPASATQGSLNASRPPPSLPSRNSGSSAFKKNYAVHETDNLLSDKIALLRKDVYSLSDFHRQPMLDIYLIFDPVFHKNAPNTDVMTFYTQVYKNYQKFLQINSLPDSHATIQQYLNTFYDKLYATYEDRKTNNINQFVLKRNSYPHQQSQLDEKTKAMQEALDQLVIPAHLPPPRKTGSLPPPRIEATPRNEVVQPPSRSANKASSNPIVQQYSKEQLDLLKQQYLASKRAGGA